MSAVTKPDLKIVLPEDSHADSMAVARMTAEVIAQMPFDAMAKRVDDDRMHVILNRAEQKEIDRLSCDNELIAVLAFAQQRVRRIKARYHR